MIEFGHDDFIALIERLAHGQADVSDERGRVEPECDLFCARRVQERRHAGPRTVHGCVHLPPTTISPTPLHVAIQQVVLNGIEDGPRHLCPGRVVEEDEVVAGSKRRKLLADMIDRERRGRHAANQSTARADVVRGGELSEQAPQQIPGAGVRVAGRIKGRHTDRFDRKRLDHHGDGGEQIIDEQAVRFSPLVDGNLAWIEDVEIHVNVDSVDSRSEVADHGAKSFAAPGRLNVRLGDASDQTEADDIGLGRIHRPAAD